MEGYVPQSKVPSVGKSLVSVCTIQAPVSLDAGPIKSINQSITYSGHPHHPACLYPDSTPELHFGD